MIATRTRWNPVLLIQSYDQIKDRGSVQEKTTAETRGSRGNVPDPPLSVG